MEGVIYVIITLTLCAAGLEVAKFINMESFFISDRRYWLYNFAWCCFVDLIYWLALERGNLYQSVIFNLGLPTLMVLLRRTKHDR